MDFKINPQTVVSVEVKKIDYFSEIEFNYKKAAKDYINAIYSETSLHFLKLLKQECQNKINEINKHDLEFDAKLKNISK